VDLLEIRASDSVLEVGFCGRTQRLASGR
jgi:hypothetical protein